MYKIYTKKTRVPTRHLSKLLLIMRLTTIILVATLMQVTAAGLAQKITINKKGATLKSIFADLRKQSNYDFLYTDELLQNSKPVDINKTGVELKIVLDEIFKDQPLTYTITDKTVVIKEKGFLEKIKDKLFADPEFFTVTGRITTAEGEPLNGAVIVIKRTKFGTTTDANGFFMIRDAKANDTITCSFIGYKSQMVPVVLKKAFYDIKLQETTNSLDEVVVQAYGQTTQRTTTGNIGKITAKDIAIQPVMDISLALEGKIPGVIVTPQTGYEGGPMKVEIRGRGSVGANFTSDPLYIIDGVPLTVLDIGGTLATAYSSSALSRGMSQAGITSLSGGQNILFSLNPSDIESIEFLKDADATAIYGSRGANGVMLITTKKGKAGQARLEATASQGLRFVTSHWDMLNTQQYLDARREAFRNDGITPTAAAAPDLLTWSPTDYTDWQKVAYGGMGKWTNAQTSYSGGTGQTTFRIAGGFNRTTDITTVSGANQKASASFNLTNHSTNKRLTTSLTANYAHSLLNEIGINGVAQLAPNAPAAFDANGNLNYAGWGSQRGSFPFGPLLRPYSSKNNSLNTNLAVNYNITKALVGRVSLGYTNALTDEAYLTPLASLDPNPIAPAVKGTGSARFGTTKNSNWIVEPQLEYNDLIGKGTFNVLLGGTLQSTTTSSMAVGGSGYTNDALLNTISAAVPATITSSDGYGQYKYTGVFARIGYNWENRYIINLSGRRDGSSRFGPGKQFGNFGAIGAAWIVSDEKWLKDALPKVISFIKFRGSYGLTGSDAVGDYKYLAQYAVGNVITYNGVPTLTPSLMPNTDYQWQVNKKLEGAFNISFFNDKINLEAVYYDNRCNNQLLSFPISEITGFTSVIANSPANVQNSGYEFTLNANLIEKKDITWRTIFNIGFNHNKLLSYPNLDQSPFRKLYVIGQSLDNVYVYNYTGVDPLTGQYTFEDHNHDGKITANESVAPGTQNDDRYVAINRAPKYAGGMSSLIRYKGITLNVNFSFRKQMGSNGLTYQGDMRNLSLYQYLNRWQYPGQVALAARLTNNPATSDNSIGSSNLGWTDASYIRLQTLALSYSFPAKLIHKIGLSNLAITFSGQNIFVLTKYKGLDPEVQTFPSMPPVRTVTSGLSCSF